MSESRGKDMTTDRAKQYKRGKIAFFVVGIVFSWITTALFVWTGSSRKIADATSTRVRNGYAADSVTVSIFLVLSWLISFPLAYLQSFRHEHKYEMSNQSFAQWLGEALKSFGIQMVLMVPMTQVMLGVIRRWPGHWWAILSALAVPFTVVLAHLAPILIMPLFNKYQPLRDETLNERLKALAARSGIQVAEILEMDMSKQTKAANAFFTGIGSSKRIVLSDTLIEELTHEEIEAVVAHEIAHQAHRDLWRLLALGTIFTTATAWMAQRGFEYVNSRSSQSSGIRGAGYVEALPLLAFVASVVGMIAMPLQNAFSRYIERQADDYALRHIENPESLGSGLGKIAEISLADPEPPRLEEILLHSHPSISERQATSERVARERQAS